MAVSAEFPRHRLAAVVTLLLLLPLGAFSQMVPLRVRETTGVVRTEIVRSGIPLPRTANVTSTDSLAVMDATGAAVPAQFEILARWNAGLTDGSAPAQWVLVSFAARSDATYRLVLDGSVRNVAPNVPLRVTQNGNRVVVDTGAAVFTIDSHSLFEEIRIGNTVVVNGGALTARVDGRDVSHATLRRVRVERSGPLVATVVVDGAYEEQLGSQRRYDFSAGSPTAIVRHSIAWEGNYCGAGEIACGGRVNGLRVQRVRNTLRLALGGTRERTLIGARDASAIRTLNGVTSIRQRLRASRTDPPRYELDPGALGTKADGALLAVSGAEGTVAIALDHMHRFEPQALRTLDDGSLAIDLADDNAWLAARQGLYATMAVAALPPNATRAQLDAAVWAPLNHPLRAWPEARWFASSDAVDDVPTGSAPQYDGAIVDVLERTIAATEQLGVFGLQSWGLFPRAWADPLLSDEIECFGNDPTPNERWDDLFWCATWTDYHNAALNAGLRAMRSAEVEWLDEIARPAALRMLHTQILQCGPNDNYFYCAQAPAGYGGYRADFNSSHAYFDNLQLHYFLTGDRTVVETLQRGARPMREYFCSRRPASACGPDDPPTDEYANLTGRVAQQWNSVYRFVGLTSDGSYLDDYRNNLARAVTQQFVLADGQGFFLGSAAPVRNAGAYTTDQLWMTALYDMKMLERLRRDTNDAPIGNPAIRPSEVITAYARTLQRLGSVDGQWPNQLDFTFSGARIGGTLVNMRANGGGSDPFLYDTGKAPLAAPVAAASVFTRDAALRSLAEDLVQRAINASLNERAPLGKIQAEFTVRLHSAIAKLEPPTPAPGGRRRAARPAF